MNAALISPTRFLNEIRPFSDYHLALTHKVIFDNKYCEFYKERSKAGDFIILDNSAAERNAHSLPLKDIVLAALLIRPKVVIMPDYLFDSNRTLDELESALRSPHLRFLRRIIRDIKLCAVVQGVDKDDWLECFSILNDSKNGIDILGIPMLTTLLFGSRVTVLDKIAKKIKKRAHLLGFWHGVPLDEVREEAKFSFVMGVDTSKPVRLALLGKSLREWTSLDSDREFIDKSCNEVDVGLLRENCAGFVEACK